jgi:hypothetical protein
LLEGINGFLMAGSGWEYALRIYKDKAVLYKYSSDGASIVSDFPVNGASVLIPQKYIRGDPGDIRMSLSLKSVVKKLSLTF